jgi:hypothetical protein
MGVRIHFPCADHWTADLEMQGAKHSPLGTAALLFNPRDLLGGIGKDACLSTTTVCFFLRT